MSISRATTLRVILLLAAITIVSQFFRVSNGVIGPELARDLALTAETLGLTGGAFFIALTVMQLPVGMLFDRFGPRRTIAVLTAIAILGALANAAATSASMLFVARFTIGIGCAASFMGAVLLTSRWFARDRYTTVLSWVFALSNLGTLLGSTPLAAASEAVGWRTAFVGAAVVTALAGTAFWAWMRDWPADRTPAPQAPESFTAVLRGLGEVLRTPGLLRVFAMHMFVYASMVTVLGVWTGPYLHDVHGLDPVTRGNVHFAMGAMQILGILCYGPLDRVFNSRKAVVLGGVAMTVACFAALALIPAPPVWLACGLLILLCLVDSFGIVIVAHGRSLFPDRLAGRGVTTVNLAQAIGTALLPVLTGLLIGGFATADGVATATGYRAAFGLMGGCLAVCALIYAGVRDSKPRG